MIVASIFAAITLVALLFWDKYSLTKEQLEAFTHPEPEIGIREVISQVRNRERKWGKKSDDEIVNYLFGRAATGNLSAWGVNKMYGGQEWEQPEPLNKEFFIKCSGQPSEPDEYWVWSRTVNKRYSNIVFDSRQIRSLMDRMR